MKQRIMKITAWIMVMSLLLSGCGIVPTGGTTETAGTVATTEAEKFAHTWQLHGQWTAAPSENGGVMLTAPQEMEASAWQTDCVLGASWELAVSIYPMEDGTARIILGNDANEIKAAACVVFSAGTATLQIQTPRSSDWKTVATGEAVNIQPDQPVKLMVRHEEDSLWLTAQLYQAEKQKAELINEEIPQRTFLAISTGGVGTDGTGVTFSEFSWQAVEKQETVVDQLLKTMQPGDPGFYQCLAEIAIEDIVKNFWLGDAPEGQIVPTWDGYPGENLPDNRGGLWEAAMLHFGIYDAWVVTGEDDYLELLKSEAQFLRSNFSESELENPSGNQLWASDDCAWVAMFCLNCYQVTGDTWFVDRAANLLDKVVARWYDEELNGIYYRDGSDFMSLYEVGIALNWLRLWEITGEQRFYDLALRSYEGMHDRLGQNRDDGLYYCEANVKWPRGEKTAIGEAGSTSFLSGNLGMAALSAKFYKLTGNQEYLDRMYKTNEGLLNVYVTDKGVLINDRDAWTNGTFAAFYVTEVLSMPDTEAMQTVIQDTALSIALNARTEDGYYGGSWNGPAEGNGSAWYKIGSTPQQSKTTGSTVLMITAAALLEAGINDYVR